MKLSAGEPQWIFTRTDVPMNRLSRSALLLACCTPAGLLLSGCGQSASSPALAPVRPIATALPPLSEPRLLPVSSDVRPVAGEWQDTSPDAAFRAPQQIATPENRSPLIGRQPEGPARLTPPTQTGPYSLQPPQPVNVPAPSSPPAADPPANFNPPGFAGPSVAPLKQLAPEFRPVQQLPVASGVTMGPARDRSGFRAVSERITALNHQAVNLANRGALYAAREDLQHALRLATQSLDAAEGTSGYSHALEEGLTALAEAEDFALHGAAATVPMQVEQIVAGHRTPVLQDSATLEISPVIAMQRYYGYAGDRLTAAAGELPAAADSLYWLGKVHNGLARQSVQADRLQGPQAMVCFRAALSAAPQHYLAANELGVLLARYGQLNDAKRLLQQSVNTRPHAAGWQNLAIVHQRLGEGELAKLAEQEFIALSGRPATNAKQPPVQWVEPQTFAATGGSSQNWEQPTTPAKSNSSAGPVATQPRSTGSRR